MAVHVLNISVDPPDHRVHISKTGVVHEDLTINEMESITEWVLEHFLGCKNAIPEHDEPDGHSVISKVFVVWFMPQTTYYTMPLPSAALISSVTRFALVQLPYVSPLAEVSSPPPQLIA
ncbi:hypothetical protein GCM10027341_32570 [Spirosoma knui]